MRFLSFQRIFWLGLLCVISTAQATKQIAITFDDAPRPNSSLTSEQRAKALLIALDASGVEQAMFFVTTKHLNEQTKPILDLYQQDGHLIANHSNQHLWLHRTELDTYQQDVLTADQALRDYPHFKPYFRYPYLDEGRDKKVVKKMQKFLQKLGYQNGYVTVDNYDWYLEKLYQDAVKAGDKINLVQMKQLYIDVLWAAIEHSDRIAEQYLGRSPKHVLLLHDNDLAAYFIGDLVMHLKAQGWEIISPLEAYQDPIAQQVPKTLFTGQGRVAALARDAGASPQELVHVAEDEAELQRLFTEYQVATAVGAAMPEWFIAEMNSQVGTWQTSNAQYRSDSEPYTDYAIEWTWGLGENSLDGRLYGLIDGKPSDDFWTYKLFWDAEQRQARLLQFGFGGRVGDGFIRPIGHGQIETIQTHSAPDFPTFTERHLRVLTPDGLLTTSFRQSEAGEWQGRRSYTWIKQPTAED
ncbi:polysaccharide deacetylase family protein [Marinicella meishanensis]|uniref:polysaccharide deacetylase family protein n=1 Tax=Marinicella meishanensis TaxID=2873263 RepID=UPI001CBBE489|nr:polysaccharide deacetylase family protein [Marinicella sp. NBU2979]